MTSRPGPVFVGVDGGGTKTRAVVIDASEAIVGHGEGGASNGSTQPLERVRKSIVDAVDSALGEAGRALADVAYLTFGLAGVEAAAAHGRVFEMLTSQFETRNCLLTTDGRIALAAATADPVKGAGVILIAGTGAISHGRNAAGAEARANGMGWIIGDEGSGFWMARKGLEAVARELDGRGPSTAIRAVLQERHAVKSTDELITAVYRSGVLPGGVAAFYPVILEAATRGDAVALTIVREAADELALAALTVARKLGLERESFPVATSGGVLSTDSLLFPLTRDRILTGAPKANVAPASHPPEIGAARLAIAKYRESARG